MPQKPLCIIPARKGSKRFPGKNTMLFRGKPLVQHAIDVAKESGVFSAICVTSDDPAVLEIARENGVDIIHERPAELSGDKVQLMAVCKAILEEYPDYDCFALLIPVAPLRTAQDIRNAYDLLQPDDTNTVFSIVKHSHPPQLSVCINNAGYLEPFFDKNNLKQSQQLTPLYHHNGTVIFCKRESFLREMDFYGSNVVPYEVPPERSVNIDEPIDMAWAEFLYERSQRQ